MLASIRHIIITKQGISVFIVFSELPEDGISEPSEEIRVRKQIFPDEHPKIREDYSILFKSGIVDYDEMVVYTNRLSDKVDHYPEEALLVGVSF